MFPLPGTEASHVLIVLIDGPAGSLLVRVSVPIELGQRDNLLASDFDLSRVAQVSAGTLKVKLLTDKLPHGAHELTIAPTGTLAAWSAPAGVGEAADSFEIYTLELVQRATVSSEHPSDAPVGPARNFDDLLGRRLGQRVEAQLAVCIADVDTVEDETVKVDVQPQRGVPALNN